MTLYRSPDYQRGFESTGHLVHCRFSRWQPFPIRTILATFDLQVTSILPIKFLVNWSFCSGEKVPNWSSKFAFRSREEVQNRSGPSLIYNQNDCNFFLSANHPASSYQVSSQTAFRSGEKLKIQSTLVVSNSKGLSEILRDIRTSTYQICRTEEKLIRLTTFNKYMCNLTPEVRDILKILWKRGEIAP